MIPSNVMHRQRVVSTWRRYYSSFELADSHLVHNGPNVFRTNTLFMSSISDILINSPDAYSFHFRSKDEYGVCEHHPSDRQETRMKGETRGCGVTPRIAWQHGLSRAGIATQRGTELFTVSGSFSADWMKQPLPGNKTCPS